tara:strand:+ start:83 stop:457 length:375 start_codon:yes stop_codon:yes gene_type:complete
MKKKQINVFGRKLELCSKDPLTGFNRNGCCDSEKNDLGKHLVCAIINQKFLDFQMTTGNDLITPKSEFNFPGLVDGDRWCVCAKRWLHAYQHECATSIILSSTHIDVLEIIDLELLKKFALDLN